jgi:DNA-binding CsgD family transcriptional regulator
MDNQFFPLEFTGPALVLPNENNHLQIEMHLPVFQDAEQYSIYYRMQGTTDEQLASHRTINLQGLRKGRYALEILAKDQSNQIRSNVVFLEFIILPPWYLKWYAFVGYVLSGLLLFSVLYLVYRRNLARAKRRESIQQERKMIKQQLALKEQATKAEQELILLRNQQLQAENRSKAEEIANSTMELVHKNKMLLDVKDTLKQIQKEDDLDIRNSIIKKILRKIDRDLDNEEKWIVFEKNFDEVHENFLNRLKEEHPNLTSKDLRLCAYLRMNLSSKEIAPLLRISVRSVEISRYRLRKKLNLPHETSLSDYILHY